MLAKRPGQKKTKIALVQQHRKVKANEIKS